AVASSDTATAIKARLTAISAYASSLGLTGAMALSSLRRLRQSLSEQLNPLGGRTFRVFYKFVFFLSREQGQKGVDVATAVEAWRFALAEVFPLVDSWCDFVPLHQRYAVSEDTWQQVLDFSCTIGADLSMYDSDGAWPVLIDEFVECYSRREHLGLSCDVCGRRPSVLLRSPSSHAFRQHNTGSNSSLRYGLWSVCVLPVHPLTLPSFHTSTSHPFPPPFPSYLPASLLSYALFSPALSFARLFPQLAPPPVSSFNEARWLTTSGGFTTAIAIPSSYLLSHTFLLPLLSSLTFPASDNIYDDDNGYDDDDNNDGNPEAAPLRFSSSQPGSALDSNRGIFIGGCSSINHSSNHNSNYNSSNNSSSSIGNSSSIYNSLRPFQDGMNNFNPSCPTTSPSPSCPIAIPLASTHRPGPISPTGVEAFQTPTYRQGAFSPTSVEPFQSPTHRAGPFSPSRGRAEEAGGAGRVGAARRALGAEVGSRVEGGLGAVFGAAGRGVVGACEVGGVGVLGRGGGRGGGGSERVKRCWRDVREETEQRERIESISLKMAGLSPPNGDCKRQRVTQW
ncbi:unnamed protein product, partial [Closterium sp. NIES-53]